MIRELCSQAMLFELKDALNLFLNKRMPSDIFDVHIFLLLKALPSFWKLKAKPKYILISKLASGFIFNEMQP